MSLSHGASKKSSIDISSLERLLGQWHSALNATEKEELLRELPVVKKIFNSYPALVKEIAKLESEPRLAVLQILALDQSEILFGVCHQMDDNKRNNFSKVVEILRNTDHFYSSIGGILGYHLAILRKLEAKDAKTHHYELPPTYDVREDQNLRRSVIRSGIEAMNALSEIYVVGGAADRLELKDPLTNIPLPAAMLPYLGNTLLEGLLRDLQAREYLYFKLIGRQVETPLVMMTSESNSNHQLIEDYLKQKSWYGRDPVSFKIATQPLVPLISTEGNWCVEKEFTPYLRPGGHGALWKIALDEGVFDWLIKQGRKYTLIRQINNPAAGIDGTLLAFAGIGSSQKKTFGFAACERLPGASEGVDVLVPHVEDSLVRYSITNIEYTDLPKELQPGQKGSQVYPANTNILFADIKAIKHVITANPLPGLVINMKTTVSTPLGEVQAGRVESLMQNIADSVLSAPFANGVKPTKDDLPSFVMLNARQKTISTAKKAYKEGSGLNETPQGAYYYLLNAYYELLKVHCGVEIQGPGTEEEYLKNDWGFLAYLHPALGPQFEIISQKIRGGNFSKHSVLELEIAELDLFNIELNGCLRVRADTPLGEYSLGRLAYSHKGGKCTLRNVTILNEGVERADAIPWKKELKYKECLEIVLHGDAEFYAQNVTFKGAKRYEVPPGYRLKISQNEEGIRESLQKISFPSWWWHYSFAADGTVVLRKMAQA
ncbi:MAG: UTP--glucose-1-phosphate uridylyltransferase [Parachlamydiales bacterium]|jgi:UDP-N-acetylglucosamine pyrophosphorylase